MKKKHVVLIVVAVLAVAGGRFRLLEARAQAHRGGGGDGRPRGPPGQGHRQRQGPGHRRRWTSRPPSRARSPARGEGGRPGHEGAAPAADRRRQPARRRPQQRVLDAGAAPGPAVRPAPTSTQARADLRRAEENFAGPHHPRGRDPARPHRASPPPRPRCRPRRAACEQARATLEGARDTLAKTTVRSPMDGIVTAKRVEEGEVAVIGIQNSPGTVLLTISDMSVVETELEVDETSIPVGEARPGGAGPHRRLPQPDLQGRGHRGRGQPDPARRRRSVQRDQVPGEGPDQGPAAGRQARPLRVRPTSSPASARKALVVPDPGPGDPRPRGEAGRRRRRARRATRRASS